MKRPVRVGIIGCGTIGSALAKRITTDLTSRAYVAYLCDTHQEKAAALKASLEKRSRRVIITPLENLIRRSDLIVEAASAAIAARIVQKSLQQHKNVLILSVGGLAKTQPWYSLLKRSRGTVWIPSGAVAGIDGLQAAREAGIRRVRLVTRKPPKGLQGAPYFKKRRFPILRGRQERCVFRGSAAQAVRAFPQNVNVAAVLSLAGIGFQKTKVEIWTSKAYRRNRHEIFVEAKSGRLHFEMENLPSPDNPRTSALAVYSAVATLKKILSTLRIGT